MFKIIMKSDQRKFDEMLLQEVCNHRNLYDVKSKTFKDVLCRRASWMDIVNKMGAIATVEKCKQRFTHLRREYSRCRAALLGGRAGAAQRRIDDPKSIFYHMKFLDPYIATKINRTSNAIKQQHDNNSSSGGTWLPQDNHQYQQLQEELPCGELHLNNKLEEDCKPPSCSLLSRLNGEAVKYAVDDTSAASACLSSDNTLTTLMTTTTLGSGQSQVVPKVEATTSSDSFHNVGAACCPTAGLVCSATDILLARLSDVNSSGRGGGSVIGEDECALFARTLAEGLRDMDSGTRQFAMFKLREVMYHTQAGLIRRPDQ